MAVGRPPVPAEGPLHGIAPEVAFSLSAPLSFPTLGFGTCSDVVVATWTLAPNCAAAKAHRGEDGAAECCRVQAGGAGGHLPRGTLCRPLCLVPSLVPF